MTPVHWYIRNAYGPQIIDVIRGYHAAYPGMIYQPDAYGITPLDTAIAVNNPDAVGVIQQLDLENKRVSAQISTKTGTPLEAKLLARLRLAKVRQDGYSAEELILEFTKDRVLGMPDILEDYIKQRRWGCTCDAAFFIVHNMTIHEEDDFPAIGAHPHPEQLFPDVPPSLCSSMTKNMWRGYKNIFSMIAGLLQGTGLSLREEFILKLVHSKPGVSFFFYKGGRIADALDTLMRLSWKWSSRRDGTFDEKLVEAGEGDYEGLPECINDLDFELVRQRLGLPRDVDDAGDFGAILCEGSEIEAIEELLRRHRAEF
ncbi:hypothetical protein DXG01_011504 [Tephrocybe rancida]|nr:hypothetical protein DXG01_011504 [Tephrocybe rancida]